MTSLKSVAIQSLVNQIMEAYGVPNLRDIGGRNGWLASEAFGTTTASRCQFWTRPEASPRAKNKNLIHCYVGNVSPLYKLFPDYVEEKGVSINCVKCEKRLEFSDVDALIGFMVERFGIEPLLAEADAEPEAKPSKGGRKGGRKSTARKTAEVLVKAEA